MAYAKKPEPKQANTVHQIIEGVEQELSKRSEYPAKAIILQIYVPIIVYTLH